MTLGQRIQQIRIEHNLSQEAFAQKLCTTRQTVSRWELDQTYPEIAKIVLMSKIFLVSIDSILKDGISTFDTDGEYFACGVYRNSVSEIVETEKFSLVLYSSPDKFILGAKLYVGYEDKKKLVAVCERDQGEAKTEYAYLIGDIVPRTVITNSERLCHMLTSKYDPGLKQSMRCLERFSVDHSGRPLPKVKDCGLPKCLSSWRMADRYSSGPEEFEFYLCTGKTEYIFSIKQQDCNIYCGASYNAVFDLGLFGGGQFFRIRNFKDNSADWCKFLCDFSFVKNEVTVPTDQCSLGNCVKTDKGYLWCVKRYSDDEIVLQGCGDDEYVYRRSDKRIERFTYI